MAPFHHRDITNAQSIAIGRQSSAQVTRHSISGNVKIASKELRTVLEDFYDALGKAQLPREETRSAQTAARNALKAVTDEDIKSDVVVENMKRIGDT